MQAYQQQEEQHTLVISMELTRGLMVLLSLALLTVGFLATLAHGRRMALASAPAAPVAAADSVRHFYLTKGTYGGANALTACASGYHMASLWEILDPSNLTYHTDLGQTRHDSGEGPTTFRGWVRTGYMSNNSDIVGRANCDVWTNGMTGHGTTAALPNSWNADWEDLHVWNTQVFACNDVNRVWCVED